MMHAAPWVTVTLQAVTVVQKYITTPTPVIHWYPSDPSDPTRTMGPFESLVYNSVRADDERASSSLLGPSRDADGFG